MYCTVGNFKGCKFSAVLVADKISKILRSTHPLPATAEERPCDVPLGQPLPLAVDGVAVTEYHFQQEDVHVVF